MSRLGLLTLLLSASGSVAQDAAEEWLVREGAVLELRVAREQSNGPCGGLLRLDGGRRQLAWRGAPSPYGCRDAFDAAFDAVRGVKTRRGPGFVVEFREGVGQRLVLIPLPHARWLLEPHQVQDPSAFTQMASREGDLRPSSGVGSRVPSFVMRNAELPPDVVAGTRQAVDALLAALERPTPRHVLYEAMFGRPVDVWISDVVAAPTDYSGRSVRLSGQLQAGASPGELRLMDGGDSLPIVPEAEIATLFELASRTLSGRELEITGVVVKRGGGHSVRFWEFVGPEQQAPAQSKERRVTLAELVTAPDLETKEVVRVVGKFRGANLYGDLPLGRGAHDWVIKEDRYAVWITGHAPRGEGWELDPYGEGGSQAWVEVVGRPMRRGKLTYLRAKRVALVQRPPGARVLPARQLRLDRAVPPVVVFVLPLPGEPVAPNARFVIQFSKYMDEDSFRERVRLRYAADGAEVPFVARYDESRRALIVEPERALAPGHRLELCLLPGIVDTEGNGLPRRADADASELAFVLRFDVSG